ncbi:MAG: FlgD immunoglobulin-like domain containing protein [Candidatus Syntrophosphaera sp.]
MHFVSGYLAGTVISDNWGNANGALTFAGCPYSSPEYEDEYLIFDAENRCSIYNNHSTSGNDIWISSYHITDIDIFLDKVTVDDTNPYITECIRTTSYNYGYELAYTLDYNEAVLDQQYADLYVSPQGNDANSGLSESEPLKTIALAIQRIGADNQNPHTIHLANGIYGADQHFPLNLRSYVSIVGESEAGVIFEDGAPTVFIEGWDSEKEATIKNITFQGALYQGFSKHWLIVCSSIYDYDGNDKFSLTMENISFRNIYPLHYNYPLVIAELVQPEKAILRNITVEDCMVSTALYFWGGGVYGDNIRIHNTHGSPYGVLEGKALATYASMPITTGGDNVFHNLEITDCNSRSVDGSSGSIVRINHSFLPTEFRNYFINCTITDNHWDTGMGAAVDLGEDAKVTFINSIISHDAGMNFILRQNDFLPSNLQFLNSLVGTSENPEDTILNLGPDNTIEWFGTNLSSDPAFYAWTDDNPYALGQDSPCIDAGTTDFSIFDIPDWYSFPSYDLAGNPRIYGDQVDLGAYEWQGQTDIEDLLAAPVFSMSNYPNPFNPTTTIRYSLPKAANVRLDILNVKGQLVRTLINSEMKAGLHRAVWDGTDMNNVSVASGVYLYRMSSNDRTRTGKMLMMK